jgi:hypothetical protein
MANVAGKIVMKLFTIGIGIPVGIVTKKAVEGIWSRARSSETPRTPSQAGVRWTDAIGWAALSAAGMVVADLLTRRGAEEAWRTLIGTEPPAKGKGEPEAAKASTDSGTNSDKSTKKAVKA